MKDLHKIVIPSGMALYEEQHAFRQREDAPLFVVKGALLARTVELLGLLLARHPPSLRSPSGHFGLREPALATALVAAVLGKLGSRALVDPGLWVFCQTSDLAERVPLLPPACRQEPPPGSRLGRWFVTLKIGPEVANYYLLLDSPSGPAERCRVCLDFGSAAVHREPFRFEASICSESCYILSLSFVMSP